MVLFPIFINMNRYSPILETVVTSTIQRQVGG